GVRDLQRTRRTLHRAVGGGSRAGVLGMRRCAAQAESEQCAKRQGASNQNAQATRNHGKYLFSKGCQLVARVFAVAKLGAPVALSKVKSKSALASSTTLVRRT